jgi:hypothetical protein
LLTNTSNLVNRYLASKLLTNEQSKNIILF